MSVHNFKTTNIKGKAYVEVNERIKYLRTHPDYSGWSLSSEIVQLDADSCVIRAEIRDDNWVLRATGFAQEDKSSSYINKTSYVENCETSAWGRALANLGIGIDTSIASSNEVTMAIAKQDVKKGDNPSPAAKEEAKIKMTSDIKRKMIEAVKNGAADKVKVALGKYEVTADQRKEILGAELV
jgi:hypothetical protein|tara:strand:+ start:2670 stop:3218 length:549 start_codon:yes stop_codon:yes gene_type:complete